MKRLLHVLFATLVAAAVPAFAQTQGVAADAVTIGAFGPITGPAAYIGLAGREHWAWLLTDPTGHEANQGPQRWS